MTGPEHYREAERLLSQWQAEVTAAAESGDAAHLEVAESLAAATMACAQVHATLALTAATAADQATAYDGDELGARSRGWAGVA